LFERTNATAIGEPLVRAMAGLPPRSGGCGVATVRVTPRATVQPCVYWPGAGAPLDVPLDLGPEVLETTPFREARSVPAACERCSYFWLRAGAAAPGVGACSTPSVGPIPTARSCAAMTRRLAVRLADRRDMPTLESTCTTIVMA